ncbi:ParB/RepB/Spo0J family partition protein [uncultured Porphyromonas sp.]|uniref:ParB/RepB/Spo0J family partition protein n=1 Tax=uncultured Porphyromonas sp. TaxID=159274 RepID=UPI002633B4A0|nr:ParB/RepB/Spo0J family partition protein [uncultured Porphyromonas sp.]
MSTNNRNSASLGRGLDALFPNDFVNIKKVETGGSSSISELPLDAIYPNPDQPRADFDAETLEELASSIKHIGLVQPITVREDGKGEGKYIIISGERRYRAARLIELETIPAYIRTVDDDQVVEMALIENIQREDLNAIEIALTFSKLIDADGLTQEELATRVGKKRATVANYLRLLKLPAQIQLGLKNRKLSMGHARALLSIEDTELQLALYKQILTDDLSVRDVEQMAREYSTAEPSSKAKSQEARQAAKERLAQYRSTTDQISRSLGTKVKMSCNASGKGRITIPFASDDQLQEILSMLSKL